MSSGESNRRILVVCQHFWPEQFRVNDIVDFLLDSGHSVDVLCGLPNYPSGRLAHGYSLWRPRTEKYGAANVYRAFEIPRGRSSPFRIILNYISFTFASVLMLRKFLKKPYDRILIYQLSPVSMALPGILLGKLRKIPITLYVLDLWPENLYSVIPIKNRIIRAALNATSTWYYRRSDRLIALSQQMKLRLLETTGKESSDVAVIPQVAEKLYEQPIFDEELSSRFSGCFNIVFTGNISPAQSFQTMIDAAELLDKEGITGVKWIIVGDGMSRTSVEKIVRARGLEGLFQFEGNVPVARVPAYTSIADVLVGCLVSSDLLEATIPAKVFSYIASGRPIVLAMDGEVQSLINEEIKCGFATPTGDAEAFAASLKQILQMPVEDRTALGERAKRYHLAHFERDKVLRQLSEFVFAPDSDSSLKNTQQAVPSASSDHENGRTADE